MGLDVAATHAIHRNLIGFAERGACVVWFSEDLDELMLFAHRIAVMRGGRIVGILPREAANRHELGRLMAGAMERAA
jgi:simple sugar transport system ATP-binding protein